ncbi:MAG: tyrosine-type recombinase/integrase [Planctomycetota bacterium]
MKVWDPHTKKQTRRSTKCTTIRDARKVVESWRREELERVVDPEAAEVREAKREREDRTFWPACEEWLDSKEGAVSAKYYETLTQRARKFWRPYFGSKTLESIDPPLIRKYLKRRKTGTVDRSTKEPRPTSDVTVNEDLKALRLFFKFCVRERWMTWNPALDVDRYKGVPNRKGRYLEADEVEALLRACREASKKTVSAKRNTGGKAGGKTTIDEREFEQTFAPPAYLHPLVVTAMFSGFRRRTLLSLEWEHIDLKRRRWSVPSEIVKTKEDLRVPALPEVVEELTRYRAELAGRDDATTRLRPDAAIFGLEADSDIKRAFRTAVTRSGVDVTFHDLRRHFTNELRHRGVPEAVAHELTGHKSAEVVRQSYQQVGYDEMKNALYPGGNRPASER